MNLPDPRAERDANSKLDTFTSKADSPDKASDDFGAKASTALQGADIEWARWKWPELK
ncbi:hypothetical protein JQ615_11980 [Bradyrhizobium jicamae]|uniref:Uncharacterized protein n=1 Tax=Bradyrhizobium jicamae TaxID=280332 RepID=A0ABS5FH45_9BRAD|nr:hypothetical protein [Bradyrhizobium jicamae]MBR0796108.1 hypothetical protein [Bradyrhizobium jicamae]